MTTNSYLVFTPYNGGVPPVAEVAPAVGKAADLFDASVPANRFLPITSWEFSSTQVLNIGSQSSGAGAGKVTFNPFTVHRVVDRFSETLFAQECSGTPWQFVDLVVQRALEKGVVTFLTYRFGLCAVSAIATAASSEAPTEAVSFEYGQCSIGYRPQDAKGALGAPTFTGWDRVRNVAIRYGT